MRGKLFKDPRILTVRWAARCHETGKVLAKGQPALYYPADRTLYHLDSETARQFAEWKADQQMGWDY